MKRKSVENTEDTLRDIEKIVKRYKLCDWNSRSRGERKWIRGNI